MTTKAKTNQAKTESHDVADIAVVGGGLTGFAMALTAAQNGAKVTLIDRAPQNAAGDTTRTTTINPKSYDHLNALGVTDGLMAKNKPMTCLREIRVSDEKTRPQPGLARPDELITWGDPKSDTPLGYVFRNAEVMAVMQELVSAHPLITAYHETAVVDFSSKHQEYSDAAAALYTDQGKVFAARLVVAADGRNSPIRQAAGIKAITRNPGQTAIVADIQCGKPHHNMAWQRFIKGGPAALMPIDDDRMMSLVWTLPDEDAQILIAADDASFSQSLMDHFGHGFGQLTVSGARLTWPLRLSHVPMPTQSRLLLAGDAAHAIHPLAGQGYNLALGDAIALSDLIKNAHATGSDLGARAGLRAYAKNRFKEVTAMTLATDGLNAVFSFGGPVTTAVTGMGMALLNASPFKNLAMKAASGGLSKPR